MRTLEIELELSGAKLNALFSRPLLIPEWKDWRSFKRSDSRKHKMA